MGQISKENASEKLKLPINTNLKTRLNASVKGPAITGPHIFIWDVDSEIRKIPTKTNPKIREDTSGDLACLHFPSTLNEPATD